MYIKQHHVVNTPRCLFGNGPLPNSILINSDTYPALLDLFLLRYISASLQSFSAFRKIFFYFIFAYVSRETFRVPVCVESVHCIQFRVWNFAQFLVVC